MAAVQNDSSVTNTEQSSTPNENVQRALQVMAFAGPKKFLSNTKLVSDKLKPVPRAGEVVVRMKLRSVNPADGLSLMGLYPGFRPTKLPATPGAEGMGHVEAIGPEVKEFEVGQRVLPLLSSYTEEGEGSWQEFCKVAAEDLVALPDHVSDEEAAQLVVNPLTALGLLRDLATPSGQYIIQTAAGSALGRLVIAMAKKEGIKTINIVRRSEQVAELKALGGDEVLCSTEENLVARVRAITGGQLAWGAIDTVAGATTKFVTSTVRDGGTVYIVGGFSSPECTTAISDLIFRGVTVTGWWLRRFLKNMTNKERRELLIVLFGLVDKKVIELTCCEKYDLADYAPALKKQQEVGRLGKVLLSG